MGGGLVGLVTVREEGKRKQEAGSVVEVWKKDRG